MANGNEEYGNNEGAPAPSLSELHNALTGARDAFNDSATEPGSDGYSEAAANAVKEAAAAYINAHQAALNAAEAALIAAEGVLSEAETDFDRAEGALNDRKDDLEYEEAREALEEARIDYADGRLVYEAARLEAEAAKAAFEAAQGNLREAYDTFNEAWAEYELARRAYDDLTTALENATNEYQEIVTQLQPLRDNLETAEQAVLAAGADVQQAAAAVQEIAADAALAETFVNGILTSVEASFNDYFTESNEFETFTVAEGQTVIVFYRSLEGGFYRLVLDEAGTFVLPRGAKSFESEDVFNEALAAATAAAGAAAVQRGDAFIVPSDGVFFYKQGDSVYRNDSIAADTVVTLPPGATWSNEADYDAYILGLMEAPNSGFVFGGDDGITVWVREEGEGGTYTIGKATVPAGEWMRLGEGQSWSTEEAFNIFAQPQIPNRPGSIQAGTYVRLTDGTVVRITGEPDGWYQIPEDATVLTTAQVQEHIADLVSLGGPGYVPATNGVYFYALNGSVFKVQVPDGALENGWFRLPAGATASDEGAHERYVEGRLEALRDDLKDDAEAFLEAQTDFLILFNNLTVASDRSDFIAARDAYLTFLEEFFPDDIGAFETSLAERQDAFDLYHATAALRQAEEAFLGRLEWSEEADDYVRVDGDGTQYEAFLDALYDFINSGAFSFLDDDEQERLEELHSRMARSFEEADQRNQDRIEYLQNLVDDVQEAIDDLEDLLDKSAWSRESLMERIQEGYLSSSAILGTTTHFRNVQEIWVNVNERSPGFGNIRNSVPDNAGAGQANAGYQRFPAGTFVFTGNTGNYTTQGNLQMWVNNTDGRVYFRTGSGSPPGGSSVWTRVDRNGDPTIRFNADTTDLRDLPDVVEMLENRQDAFDNYIELFEIYWREWFTLEAVDPDRPAELGGPLTFPDDAAREAWIEAQTLRVVNGETARFDGQTTAFNNFLRDMSEYMWFQARLEEADLGPGEWVLATHPVTGTEVILAAPGAFLSFQSNYLNNPIGQGQTHTPLDAAFNPITANHFPTMQQHVPAVAQHWAHGGNQIDLVTTTAGPFSSPSEPLGTPPGGGTWVQVGVTDGTWLGNSSRQWRGSNWTNVDAVDAHYITVENPDYGRDVSLNIPRPDGTYTTARTASDLLPRDFNNNLRWESFDQLPNAWTMGANQTVTAVYTEFFANGGIFHVPTDANINSAWRLGANAQIDWIHHESEVRDSSFAGAPPTLELAGIRDFPPPTYFGQGETTNITWTFDIAIREIDPENLDFESNSTAGAPFAVELTSQAGNTYVFDAEGINLTPDMLSNSGNVGSSFMITVGEGDSFIATIIDLGSLSITPVDGGQAFIPPEMPDDFLDLDPLNPLNGLVRPETPEFPGPGPDPEPDPEDPEPDPDPEDPDPEPEPGPGPDPDPEIVPALIPGPDPAPVIPIEEFEIPDETVPLAPPAADDYVPTVIIEDPTVPLAPPDMGEVAGFITTGLILAALTAAVIGNTIRRMRTEELAEDEEEGKA